MSDKITPIPLLAIRSRRVRDDLDGLITRKREIELEIKPQLDELDQISSDLTSLFLKNDLEKVRMPDGTSVSKSVTTTSRIIAEKLLLHKVSMSTIEACTDTTTSKPYVRVYYPCANKNGETK